MHHRTDRRWHLCVQKVIEVHKLVHMWPTLSLVILDLSLPHTQARKANSLDRLQALRQHG